MEGMCLTARGEQLQRTEDSERVVFAHGSHPAASADAGPSRSGKPRPQKASGAAILVRATIFSYLDPSSLTSP